MPCTRLARARERRCGLHRKCRPPVMFCSTSVSTRPTSMRRPLRPPVDSVSRKTRDSARSSAACTPSSLARRSASDVRRSGLKCVPAWKRLLRRTSASSCTGRRARSFESSGKSGAGRTGRAATGCLSEGRSVAAEAFGRTVCGRMTVMAMILLMMHLRHVRRQCVSS